MTIAEGTLFGPYRLLEKIGSGGMGEVYRALDTRLEREVALKLVSESYLATELGSGSPSPATPHSGHLSHERFLREARSAATLNHPNVCTIHDVGPKYLVMELVEGPTLSDLIKEGPIPLEEALRIARQIADALEAAHEKGIVHRDLKPGNIKIKPDGTVKVRISGWRSCGQ